MSARLSQSNEIWNPHYFARAQESPRRLIVISTWLDVSGWNKHKKKSWHYLNIDSAIRPAAHCDGVPIPIFTSLPDLILDELDLKTTENEDSVCSSCSNYNDIGFAAEGHSQENKPSLFT